MEEVTKLEQRLTSEGGGSHLSDITSLYLLCESSDDIHVVAAALRAIAHVLSHHRHEAEGDAQPGLAEWLARQTDAFHKLLAQLVTSANPHAQVCAVRLAMEAVRDEDREARVAVARLCLPTAERRLSGIVQELLIAPHWSEHACECLTKEYVQRYVDVRDNVVNQLRLCCQQLGQAEAARKGGFDPRKRLRDTIVETCNYAELVKQRGLGIQEVFSRVFAILREAPPQQGEDKEDTFREAIWAPGGKAAGSFTRRYRTLFKDTWLQLLGLPVTLQQCAQVLQFLPAHVMPHLSEPLMLADFYLRAFNSSSVELSVLSLSGLLTLLTKHGLGDPETLSSSSNEFYAQLYSLVKPETFKLRKRARFQRLLVAALTSGLLPARFAAAFAKKCARTAISCNEPGTVLWLLSVAYGLIQKHHSHCQYLLHHPPAEGEVAQSYREDPFDSAATFNTALEQAPTSSLWELNVLQRHHVPAVARMAQLFLRPFFKPSSRRLDPEGFLDYGVEKSYGQALRSGQRQLTKWKGRSQECPMAFKVEDNAAANRVLRMAALLSTEQRKVGPQG